MEIVVRAAVIFVVLWLITRAVGRTTLGELSAFELLLYVTMGDLVQQSITQQDYSVTAGVLAVGTFALLTVMLSWAQWHFPRVRDLVTGRPILVMRDGEPRLTAMRRQRLALDDLLVAAREQGIERLADVRYAVLEADGRLSFLVAANDGAGQSGAPEKPPGG